MFEQRQISYLLILLMTLLGNLCHCQTPPSYDWGSEYTFTKADTLRGQLSPSRSCFDVTHYFLDISLDHHEKMLAGSNTITFDWLAEADSMQVDLFSNLAVDSITYLDIQLEYHRLANAIFIHTPEDWDIGNNYSIRIHYSGQPTVAKNAPWDGGITWTEAFAAKPWFSVSCEGIGASLWWPNKDHLSDEPDSMDMAFTVDSSLKCISNGRLKSADTTSIDHNYFHWSVKNKINNYNVTFYASDYVRLVDTFYTASQQALTLDYYVLPEHAVKAEQHFKQMHGILEAFEYYFGEYPYINDGFKLVEAPYLGMEHQSAIAYGNNYQRGYRGGMIPPEMEWDYILVHETGHEYFGNSVSCNDHAEMWIHESFTTYMEALYVEYHSGIEAALRYLSFFTKHANKQPIIGPLDVNFTDWESSDHYFKGSWILHTLRHCIYDDEVWFDLLRSLYDTYAHGHTTTEEIITYVNTFTGKDYTAFFYQYLYTPDIPVLKVSKLRKGKVALSLHGDVSGLSLDLQSGPHGEMITVSEEQVNIKPTLPMHDWIDWISQRYLLEITID